MSKSAPAPPGGKGPSDAREVRFVDVMAMLSQQKWTIIAITLLAAAGAALFTFLATPVYEASALILVDRGERNVLPFVDLTAGETSTWLANELEMLRSRAVAQAVATRLMEREYVDTTGHERLRILAGKEEGEPATPAEVVRRLQKNVDVTPIRGSDVIRIVAESPGQEEAPLIVSTYLEAFNDRNREMSMERTRAAREFLEAQLRAKHQALNEKDSALQAYMRKSGVVSLDDETRGIVEQMAQAVVIDPPSVPDEPVSPRKFFNILVGLAAGLVLGTIVAVIRSATDARLRSPSDISRLGYKLYASIRRIQWIRKNAKKRSGILDDGRWYDTSLIPLFHPFDPATESFRQLLTALIHSEEHKAPKRVMITSANPGEGKTLVVANLAVTAAQLRKRVLLIDVDLRRPTLHKLFNVVPSPGLSDYIGGASRFDEVVRINVLENLDVICCGTEVENSARILTSWRLREFLEKLAPAYDLFLFDTPPLLAVSDAGFLCASMDVTLVVVSGGETKADQLQRVMETLQTAGAPATGVVFNNYDAKRDTGAPDLYGYSTYSFTSSDRSKKLPVVVRKLA